MDRTEFWSLVEKTKKESGGDCERQAELLRKKLVSLPIREIIDFDRIVEELLIESYNWNLWAAAYLINGGCGDDGFDYFRGWLIAQGESIYSNALKNPETLADFPDDFPEYAECEEFLSVAAEAYEQKTGQDLDTSLPPPPSEPRGQKWDEEKVELVLPRLAARMKDRFRT
jgi:hypothetical protein